MTRSLVVVVGALVAAVGYALGAWWLVIVVGAVVGLLLGAWSASAAGLLAWLLDLALVWSQGPVLRAAQLTAAIAGFPTALAPIILLLGALVSALGAGLAGALAASLRRARPRRP